MIQQFNLRLIIIVQFLIILSSCKPAENCDYHLIFHGTVTDSGGSPISNVAITFSNSISGPALAMTDSNGYYNTGSRLYYVSIKDAQIAMAK